MTLDLTIEKLTSFVGHRVEVLAFGTTYVGKLTEINKEDGKIRITDNSDFVVLEIERIQSLKCLDT